jgi:hypothetical protein
MPDAAGGAVRFGVLGDGALAAWQTRCLEELLARLGASPQFHWQRPQARRPEASADARAQRLDFLLCFDEGDPPPALLDAARWGTWRFLWGGVPGGEARGFWEVFQAAAVSSAQLVRVHPDGHRVTVLKEGHLRTRSLSVTANRDQWHSRFASWPAEVCARLVRAPDRAFEERAAHAAPPAPRPAQRAVLRLRIGARMAAAAWRALFRHDQWNVGILDRPLADVLTLEVATGVRWLPPTAREEFRADPFGAVVAGRPLILCEHYSYRDNLGYIVALDEAGQPQGGARVRIGPEPPVHLSYPFLVECDGQTFCLPESSAAHEVCLYVPETLPGHWRRAAVLIGGRDLVDATVFEHAGRWWLAASEVADKGANSELHLWHAEALTGPWNPHPGNPVKIDVRSARPAGPPFRVDGVLYRPAQDCSTTYGARVVVNRVLTLTPDEFREEVAAVLNPDPRGAYPDGLHTVSTLGGRTLIDGKRRVFVPAEFLRMMRRYLP